MEKKGRKIFKTRRKMLKQQIGCVQHPNPQTIFAIILAALCGVNNSQNSLLIIHSLNLIHRSIAKYLSPPFLSLLPVLLKSSCGDIASKTAVIVGAASLESIEMNEMIAMEDGIIRALLCLLTTSTESVLMDACSAILDLSTTSLGRLRLLQFSAIEKLSFNSMRDTWSIFCYTLLYTPEFPVHAIPSLVSFQIWVELGMSRLSVLCLSNGSCLRVVFKEDSVAISLLNAAIILINSCTIGQLEDMPRNLCGSLHFHMIKLWEKVHQLMICGDFLNSCSKGDNYVSNIDTKCMAESIFRFCISDHQNGGRTDINEIRRSVFQAELDFELFISSYWEKSPLLIRGSSNASLLKDNICSTLSNSIKFEKDLCSLIPLLLKNVTSCPPISSDELDILHFLEEVRDYIGCPLIYQQDIRVIKTCQKEEVHYFPGQSASSASPDFHLLLNEILKCQDAYNEGYTIALRGMGFRFQGIAAVAEGLASLFGQPSVGVNMYLTPANSQGLACHTDDHCVFVCQLAGEKEWKLYPLSNLQLPRLYESTNNLPDSGAAEQSNEQSQQFLLKEGDVLYIPRGVPHEAHTVIDGDVSGGSSLHLTLGIEVEPPFEWEGFTHTAVDCWFKKQKGPQNLSSTSLCWDIHVVSVLLLHVSIKQIGNLDPAFREACLVGSISLSSKDGWLFKSLVTRINTESNFSDAISRVENAALNHEDIFQRERWLHHLYEEGENTESNIWNISSANAENILCFCNQHKNQIESVFSQVKSRFCNEVMLEDVEPHYKKLLDRYKVARTQYTNGMLSLHLTGDEHETKM